MPAQTALIEPKQYTKVAREVPRGDELSKFIADWLGGEPASRMARTYGYADRKAVLAVASRLNLPARTQCRKNWAITGNKGGNWYDRMPGQIENWPIGIQFDDDPEACAPEDGPYYIPGPYRRNGRDAA